MKNKPTTTMTNVSGASYPPPPLLYRSLVVLDSVRHGGIVVAPLESYGFAAEATMVPVMLNEAALAQADYPIVFTTHTRPMPVVLTGLPGQKNRFIDALGRWKAGAYIPAYLRRYPFLLARNPTDTRIFNLCFDPTADCISEKPGEGNLFDKGEPSQTVQTALRLCEDFEAAARRTEALMAELNALDLFVDGQVRFERPTSEPVTFQGFRVVSEARLLALPDADLGKLLRTGALAFIHAHLFSLRHMQHLATTGTSTVQDRAEPPPRGKSGRKTAKAKTRH